MHQRDGRPFRSQYHLLVDLFMIHTQWSRKPIHSTFGEFLRRKSLSDSQIIQSKKLCPAKIYCFIAKMFGVVFIVV